MPNNNPQSSQQSAATRSEGASKISDRIEQTAEQTSQLAERLGHSLEESTDAALSRVREARERARAGLEDQREQLTGRLRRFGDVLRNGGESLDVDDPFARNLLDGASERIERIAGYLGRVSPEELAEDVQTFARRQPGLFFGGAFLLGLGLGRFAKSSSGATAERTFDRPVRRQPGEALAKRDRESDLTFGARETAFGDAPSAREAGGLGAARETPRGQGAKS